MKARAPWAQVFLKELREMMRDKRVRSSALFGPFFLVLIMFGMIGLVIEGIGKKEGQTVHVVRTQNPALEALRQAKFNIKEVANREEADRLVRTGKARLVLEFGPAPQRDGEQQTIYAHLDPKQQTGQIALSMVQGVYSEVNRLTLQSFLQSRSLPTTAAEAIKVERREVQVGEKGAGDFLVQMLPYMIVLWAFYGGFSLASELVAGEKEKNTLETLLISPVRRTHIVMGKFLALGALCLVSSLMSLAAMALMGVAKLPGSQMLMKGGFGISPVGFLLILVLLVPLVAFFASILMAISTYAKSTREAQSYIGLASFVVVLPAAFSQLIGLTDVGSSSWIHWIPILNTANNIRNVLLGKADFGAIAITSGMSLVLAAIAVYAVLRLFNREEVLTRV